MWWFSKITMVVFECSFPVVTATVAGIASVEKELVWTARNMGAKNRELLWQILLPAALPQILTGLQVALPIALGGPATVTVNQGGAALLLSGALTGTSGLNKTGAGILDLLGTNSYSGTTAVGGQVVKYPEEVLAVWEYLERSVPLAVIKRVFDQTPSKGQ